MKDAKGESWQKNREKEVRPTFLCSFIINEEYDKNAQHNAAINEYKEELIKEFVQVELWLRV